MLNNSSIVAIITVVILSSVVVFSGLSAPSSAQFASFCQDVDNVYYSVLDSFADLKVEYALNGEYRTNEQIYYEVATGIKPSQDSSMMGANVKKVGNDKINCQRINPDKSLETLNLTLPNVRETNVAWYVTVDGEVFNATGYVYDEKTYFNASCYKYGELSASKTNTQEKLAIKIAETLLNNENIVK